MDPTVHPKTSWNVPADLDNFGAITESKWFCLETSSFPAGSSQKLAQKKQQNAVH